MLESPLTPAGCTLQVFLGARCRGESVQPGSSVSSGAGFLWCTCTDRDRSGLSQASRDEAAHSSAGSGLRLYLCGRRCAASRGAGLCRCHRLLSNSPSPMTRIRAGSLDLSGGRRHRQGRSVTHVPGQKCDSCPGLHSFCSAELRTRNKLTRSRTALFPVPLIPRESESAFIPRESESEWSSLGVVSSPTDSSKVRGCVELMRGLSQWAIRTLGAIPTSPCAADSFSRQSSRDSATRARIRPRRIRPGHPRCRHRWW